MSTQPEALRLAELLETNLFDGQCGPKERSKAAAELRRLHTENVRITAELNDARDTIKFGNRMSTLDYARYEQARADNLKLLNEISQLCSAMAGLTKRCVDDKALIGDLLDALKTARNEATYMAGGMTHAAWKTAQAVEALKKIDAAVVKAEGAA